MCLSSSILLLPVTVNAALAAGTDPDPDPDPASLSVLPYCEVPSAQRELELDLELECKSDANSAVRRSAASALPCLTLSKVSVSCMRSRQGNAIMAGRAPGNGEAKGRQEENEEIRKVRLEKRRDRSC